MVCILVVWLKGCASGRGGQTGLAGNGTKPQDL